MLATVVLFGLSQLKLFQIADLSFYDHRLEVWNSDSDRSLPPMRLYSYRDSTKETGLDRTQFLNLLNDLQQAGVVQIYILSKEILEDLSIKRRELPPGVVAMDADRPEDEGQLFLGTGEHEIEKYYDADDNLRGLPWDHPGVLVCKDMFELTNTGWPEQRGSRLMLKPNSRGSNLYGQDAAGGSALEFLIEFLGDAKAQNDSGSIAFLKDSVVVIEQATTEADSDIAEVSTPFGALTTGQIYLQINQTAVDGWTPVEMPLWLEIVLGSVIAGGLSYFLSGRKPIQVALIGFPALGLLVALSYQLLPLELMPRILHLLVWCFFVVFWMIVLEMRRSRDLLKSFGGKEDAQFGGEETEATMVFTNLPPFLLDMERNHDADLLKYRRDYNSVLAIVARRYHGKVLDYQGDAQMLGFGLRPDDDPEHAAEATSAALEIVEEVAKLAQKWDVPEDKLRVHVGVCTGSIALGHLGAEQKQDIAAIGDTTNTAARLMGAAMKQKRPVLISKPTYVRGAGVILGEELEAVELKGKTSAVEVYEAHSVDPEWQESNRGKDKEATPSGGTLVYKGHRRGSELVATVLLGLIGASIAYTVWRDEIVDESEIRYADILHRVLASEEADPRIVIAGIDEESLKTIGPFPWRRSVYAEAIENLKETGYEGFFLDIMFKTPRPDDPLGDRRLTRALLNEPRAVVAVVLYKNHRNRLEDPVFFAGDEVMTQLRERNQLGLIHSAKDKDDVARSGYLAAPETNSHQTSEAHLRTLYPSAATALLLSPDEELKQEADEVWVGSKETHAKVDSVGKSTVRIRYGPPATPQGEEGKPGSYKVISFSRLLDKSDPIFQELDGKYILVGQILSENEDFDDVDRIPTVVGKLKGVEVHARLLDSLLNDNYLRVLPFSTRIFILWTVSLLTVAILSAYRDPKDFLIRLLGLAALLGILNIICLVFFSLVTEVVMLWTAMLIVLVCVGVGRYVLTFKALTRVIPKQVAEELLYHREVDRRQEATILLTDIRGYTTLSEGRTAVAMLDVLNEYHKRTVNCYDRHGGQALTYQGDAQIVIFGVFGNRKNPAADAVAAALGLQAICDELREEWGIESRDDFDVGAGLCTGEVEVGFLGGEDNRQYSVVGETVRKAHKVQSLSADLEAPVIIDEETYEATRGAVEVDDLGMVQPKGLPAPIRLYRAKSVNQ